LYTRFAGRFARSESEKTLRLILHFGWMNSRRGKRMGAICGLKQKRDQFPRIVNDPADTIRYFARDHALRGRAHHDLANPFDELRW
jgi:hypothetical protein